MLSMPAPKTISSFSAFISASVADADSALSRYLAMLASLSSLSICSMSIYLSFLVCFNGQYRYSCCSCFVFAYLYLKKPPLFDHLNVHCLCFAYIHKHALHAPSFTTIIWIVRFCSNLDSIAPSISLVFKSALYHLKILISHTSLHISAALYTKIAQELERMRGLASKKHRMLYSL